LRDLQFGLAVTDSQARELDGTGTGLDPALEGLEHQSGHQAHGVEPADHPHRQDRIGVPAAPDQVEQSVVGAIPQMKLAMWLWVAWSMSGLWLGWRQVKTRRGAEAPRA